MKLSILLGLALLCSGTLVSLGQTPKLALMEATATPTLAKKYGLASSDGATPAPAVARPANPFGVWRGTVQTPGRGPVTVTLSLLQQKDGSVGADYRNETGGRDFNIVSVVGSAFSGVGNNIKITMHPAIAKKALPVILMAEFSPDFQILTGEIIANGGRNHNPLRLTRNGAAVGAANAGAPGDSVSLENLLHSVDVQLFDKFNGEQFFTVVGQDELSKAVPALKEAAQAANKIRAPEVQESLKQAGINYVLVTTLEDFQDQTIDMHRTQATHYQAATYNRVRRPGAVAAVATAGQTGLDPEVWQRQIITVNVRCQLVDGATGEVKKSANASFPTQRDYLSVAQGKNDMSSSDLMTLAAQRVSDWAAIQVDDTVFPIEVLAVKENFVTIGRGKEAGLKEGQVFTVTVEGDEVKDPRTGKVLGRELKTVGRVTITELQPKFSKARIMENNGIVNGAVLTRKTTN